MINISVTKMSSKGQIVIPVNMRSDFKEGDDIVLIKDDKRIILKKAEHLTEQMKEDLEFARRTEDAWKAYDRGEFKTYSEEEFLEKLEKW